MSKMGSHDPFGYLKHKLWPKERLGVKLAIWLPTTKSLDLPWFLCMQVACHILSESSQPWLQLCFRPHLNQRSAHKVMGPQSCGSPNFKNFGINLGVPRENDIWVLAPWLGTKNTIRGKVIASPSSGRGEFYESVFICGLSVHQKCSNYALTNLLFGLCRFVWVIDLLVTLSSPYPKASTRP